MLSFTSELKPKLVEDGWEGVVIKDCSQHVEKCWDLPFRSDHEIGYWTNMYTDQENLF